MKKVNGKIQSSSFDHMADFVFGKVPPQAIPIEEAVLGAALIDKEAVPLLVSMVVTQTTFYLDNHKFIWAAMASLFDKSAPIDLLTVTEELKRQGTLEAMGGPYYLVELTNKVASSANIEYHTRILKQQEMRRQIIEMSSFLIREAFAEQTDVFELLELVQERTSQIAGIVSLKSELEGVDMFELVMKDLEQKLNTPPGERIDIKTGLEQLDEILKSLQPGQFGILAARPGMGKTAFLISVMKFIAHQTKIKCGIVSLEMTNMQTYWRLCSQICNIPVAKMKAPETLTPEELKEYKEAAEIVKQMPIIYYDGEESLGVVTSKIRAMAAKGAKIVFLDYLQLVTTMGAGNREQEVSKISRKMKSLAKELNIIILALSQLSRDVEKRGGVPRPKLSDLRESGSLEQDADFIIFIFRPEYHGITKDENGDDLPKGLTELIVAKNRDGACDTAFAIFVPSKMQFADNDDDTDDDLPF
jgi:replicative DNA helicase